MTIATELRRAGPFTGNGATVSFPFGFKVFAPGDVLVVRTDGDGDTDLSLTTDYSVLLAADQNAQPGGSVVLSTPLASGAQLTILSQVAALQPTELTNQGGFYPQVLTRAFDRATILIQQLAERVGRSLVLSPTEGTVTIPAPSQRTGGRILGFNRLTGAFEVQDGSAFKGDPGASDNTYTTLAELLASDPTRKAARLAPEPGETAAAGDFYYTGGAWVRQPALGIATTDGDLQTVLDARKPVTVTLYRYAIEINDDAAWLRALAAVTAAGGGRIELPARQIVTTQTWFVPSRVTVSGMGDASHILFTGANPAAIPGTPATPRWGNPRTSAIAVVGRNPDDMTAGVYNDGQTGDYATTDLRAFAANTELMPGATQMTVADATGLAAGGFIWLEAGWIGWHTALHEIVKIKSVAGNVVTFAAPILYRYTNKAGDAFNDFFDKFGYGGSGPPGVTDFPSWRQSGYRRVEPIENAGIRDLKITNTIVRAGYANLAIAVIRGYNCAIDRVSVDGGGVWNIDSDGTTFDGILLDRTVLTYPQADFLPANGCTRLRIRGMVQKNGSLYIEEGGCDGRVQGSTTGQVFVNQYCREIAADLFVTQDQNYALRVEKCAQVQAAGQYVSTQPAVQYGTKDFFTLYPGATLAHWKAVGEYFDGSNFRFMPGSFAYSTANNSRDLYGEQSFVADDAEVGGQFGDFFDLGTGGAGYALGSLRRRQDQARVGSPRVTARPTFYPKGLKQIVYDTSADRAWGVVNLAIKTVNNVPSSTTFVVNNLAGDGGVKAGDVVRVIIENQSTVTAADGNVYAQFTARAWHYSVVTAADTGTQQVTIAAAVPNNWAVKTGDDGRAYFVRWG